MEVTKPSAEKVIKDIRLVTHKQYSLEEKIRIVLDGLTGDTARAATTDKVKVLHCETRDLKEAQLWQTDFTYLKVIGWG